MAIYHCTTNTKSRGKGKSATAAAAYRAGERIVDERTGEIFDYSHRHGVEHTQIFTPEHAPEWMLGRAALWNAAEKAERYKTAVVAREIESSLPHELNAEQRRALACEYADHLVERYGVAVDMSLHKPDPKSDERNHHAHYLMSTRKVTREGFGGKCELELSGKKKKELGFATGKAQVMEIRKSWADYANRALERAGHSERIDHRSLEKQGVERKPTVHMGRAATDMERKGKKSRIGDENREIIYWNRELADMKWQMSVIDKAIEAEERKSRAAKEKGAASGAFEKKAGQGKYAFDERTAHAMAALHLKHADEEQALSDKTGERRVALEDRLTEHYRRKEKERELKNAQSRLNKLEGKGFFGRLWNRKETKALQDDIPALKRELRETRRLEDGQTGLLERDIRRERQQLERRQSLERAALEKEYVRPANDNSLKRAFETAERQQDESREPERGGGRERTIPPPGYGRGR